MFLKSFGVEEGAQNNSYNTQSTYILRSTLLLYKNKNKTRTSVIWIYLQLANEWVQYLCILIFNK